MSIEFHPWKRGSRYHGHSTDDASAAAIAAVAANRNSGSHFSILCSFLHSMFTSTCGERREITITCGGTDR